MKQPVKVLANGLQSAGQHIYTWDAISANGSQLTNGLYRVVAIIDGKIYSSAIQVMR
jgi:flagellar hook assembly protein FlgD